MICHWGSEDFQLNLRLNQFRERIIILPITAQHSITQGAMVKQTEGLRTAGSGRSSEQDHFQQKYKLNRIPELVALLLWRRKMTPCWVSVLCQYYFFFGLHLAYINNCFLPGWRKDWTNFIPHSCWKYCTTVSLHARFFICSWVDTADSKETFEINYYQNITRIYERTRHFPNTVNIMISSFRFHCLCGVYLKSNFYFL